MKKIKRIYNGLIAVGFMVLGVTLDCNDDFLDILPYGKTVPKDIDDLAKLLNDEDEINTNLFGSFCKILDDYTIPEDNISSTDLKDLKAYTWRDYLSSTDNDPFWNKNYKVIAIANFVLNHIDSYSKGDKFKAENTKGRALFLRANAYFYLINGYAKMYDATTASSDLGVPLPLKMDINENLPRSTVQQGYDLIINDLTQAAVLLDPKLKYSTWPCKAAAYALLGRVYLYQKKYAQSAKNSNQALSLYHSLSDYNTFVYDDFLGVSGYNDDIYSNEENLFTCYYGFGFGVNYCSVSLINVYEKEKDLRFRYFMSDHDYLGEPLKGFITANSQMFYGWAGITTPEVYLNYAEALMRQSPPQIQEALTWLNKLRKNRYDASTYTPYTSSDSSEVLKEVMLERRRELRFTAWRWFDMKRLGVECSRTVNGKTYTLKANSNNYVWPIPLNAMSINPLLKQNPRGL